jgi:hypothetical protein
MCRPRTWVRGTVDASSRRSLTRPALLALLLLLPRVARAVDPFEIQVYEGDINQPLRAGLELHSNFVADGRRAPSFVGEEVPHGAWRTTLEPSFGVLPWWELGAYLQLLAVPSRSQAHFGGFKLRSKLVVPRRAGDGLVLGLNVEVGRGVAVLGSQDWDTEFRPIVAVARGRWFAAINPILGWALSGDRHAAPELEPCGKLRADTGLGFALGVEYYAGLGRLDELATFRDQQHFVYLTGDLVDGPLDVNAGVGRGLTPASDDWTVKVILGKAF